MQTVGLPRSYYYRWISGAIRQIIEREQQEGSQPEMVMKINIQEQLNRLEVCPACGRELYTYANEFRRSCEAMCGVFAITNVYSDGTIDFTFTLDTSEAIARKNYMSEETAESDDDGSVRAVQDRQL